MAPKAAAKGKGKAAPKKGGLIKKVSTVHAIDSSGQIFKGFNIWTTVGKTLKENPDLLFVKCAVQPGSTIDLFKVKQVEPPDPTEEIFDVPQGRAWNCNTNIDPLTYPDISGIPHTNIPCVLDFIRYRYERGQIYCTADPLLCAVNPFKNVGNAGDDYILKYRDAPSVDNLEPHVFGISRFALENLHMVKKSQTIIVSGESGAGKTEAVKMAMRFFAAAKSGKVDTRIQNAIMSANPVLEAFGNAKTIRNNNSSRFGRFMQLQVAQGGGMTYGSVRNFLLEKSRILFQEETERTYHIFYQFLKGATDEQRKKWHLLDITKYDYVNPHCLDTPGMDDLEEWDLCNKAFPQMNLDQLRIDSIWSIVSGVFLLGNVSIGSANLDGIPDAAVISEESKSTMQKACELLFLDAAKVEEGLTIKISFAAGNVIRGRWTKPDCEMLKASLSKAMFDKLFDWIVVSLNKTIEPPEGFEHFMGVLDIFGFEALKNNSLEQLFINITNEMLQKNFTDVVFDRESKLYNSEGISAADLVYTSNADVINVLMGKKSSLMTILEDQCLAPGGTDESFLALAYKQLEGDAGHNKLIRPKVAADINFGVEHSVGEIPYVVHNFLFKNKDILRPDLIEVVQASENPVARALFEGVEVIKGKSAKGQLIGSQFMNQLEALMTLITATETHFIRCIKPNETKTPLKFVPSKILIQLQALSVLEALQLKNLGYSYRRQFKEFLYQYKFVDLSIAENTSLEPSDAAKKLLERAGITSGWAVGKTMIFLKPQAMKDIAHKQRVTMAMWEPLVSVVEALWAKRELKNAYSNRHKPISRIQALARRKIRGKVETPHWKETTLGWFSNRLA